MAARPLSLAYRKTLLRPINIDTVVLALVVAVVFVLGAAPLVFLVWNSFKLISVASISDFTLSNWTLSNYATAYSDPRTLAMFGNSFVFAGGSMIVALFFGGLLAFLVERTNMPLRNAVYGFMFIPLALPGMLKALGWTLLLNSRTGLLNQPWYLLGFEEPLFDAHTLPAMFWVEGLSMAPLTFLMLGAALRMMDPALEEAAATSGANSLQTALRVTLQLMWPALGGIALLLFVRGIESFDVPLVMGAGKGIVVFSTNIYLSIREIYPPNYGNAFVFSITLVVIALVGVTLYQRALGKYGRYNTISGKGYRPRLIELGKWRPWAAALAIIFVMVAMVLPLSALIWASLFRFYRVPSWEAIQQISLQNYQELFSKSEFMLALANTAMLGTMVAVGCMFLAVIVSWMVIRVRGRGTKILDFMVFGTYAIPSIAIGFSFMVLFLAVPNPVYGTLWLLGFAYMANYLAVATRFTHAGVAQLGKELEEAASTSGASLSAVLRRVTVPLILPSVIGGGLFIFLLTAKVPTIAMLLFNPDTLVMSVWAYRLWTEGSIGLTSALSVLMIFGLTTVIIAGRSFIQRQSVVE